MKGKILILAGLIAIIFSGCNCMEKSNSVIDGHNSRNSLDWAGSYKGVLPCADCEGIETTITLNYDNSFSKSEIYLKNKEKSEFSGKGDIEWDKNGNIITLKSNNYDTKYLVGEGRLIMLDRKGKRIKGNLADLYILNKIDRADASLSFDKNLEDKTWMLTRFLEKAVKGNKDTHYIIFISEDHRLSTKVGCNIIFTSYEISGKGNIKFNTLASTKMYCPDTIEDEYARHLETIDSYLVSPDGKKLTLRHSGKSVAEYELAE